MGRDGGAVALERPVIWRPHRGFQAQFLSCGSFEALGGGAAGPGKTDCLIVLGARYAHHPSARVLFLRTIFKDLLDVMDRMQALYPAMGAWYEAKDHRWRFPEGGSVELGYGKNTRELGSYLGREFTAILFDELGLLGEENSWLQLMSRVRSTDPSVPLRMRGSANPGGPGHAWLKRRFVEATARGVRVALDSKTGHTIAFVPGLGVDNPSLPPAYWARMDALPELMRRAWKYGDWDAAGGLAFGELEDAIHLRPTPKVQPWWAQWGGFDWGYAHWAVFCWFGMDEAGQVWLLDTVWCRRQWPDQIADAVWEAVRVDQLAVVYAGRDVRQVHQARGTVGPSVADAFQEKRITLSDADDDRIQGYAFSADLVCWRGRGPGGEDVPPRVLFADTPGNRKMLVHLQGLVLDPLDPRKVLKVNADPETGEGGDDGYDAFRYGLLSHQRHVQDPALLRQPRAWDPEVLRLEAERRRHDGRTRLGGPPRDPRLLEGAWEVGV